MFYRQSSFNENRNEREVSPDAVFIINDIELMIPPTNININKEDMYWNWKTLRSRRSTKVASGQGFCQIGLNIIFTPDLLLHLHRLIVQIKNSPFCFIENQFVRDNLAPNWEITKFMAFTVSAFNVSNVQGMPGTFRVQLDLKWFNYEPYGSNFLYKKDFLTYPIQDIKDNRTYYRYTIPTIVGRDLLSDYVKIWSSYKERQHVEKYNLSIEYENYRTALDNKVAEKITGEAILGAFTGFINDGRPLPSLIMPSDPSLPFDSNIYKRYINDLQLKALYENFNIDAYAIVEQQFGVGIGKKPTEDQKKKIAAYWKQITIGSKLTFSDKNVPYESFFIAYDE